MTPTRRHRLRLVDRILCGLTGMAFGVLGASFIVLFLRLIGVYVDNESLWLACVGLGYVGMMWGIEAARRGHW